jgi:oxygen-dependent protoporphyrinogen oxidase
MYGCHSAVEVAEYRSAGFERLLSLTSLRMNRKTTKSVAVVGAGIAGLTAAYSLGRVGMDVVVFEASARVGGRMSTDRIDGYLIDRGAQFLSDGYTVIGRLIEELGLSPYRVRASGWTGTIRNGKVRRLHARYPWTIVTSGLLNWQDALQTVRATRRFATQSANLPLSDYSRWGAFDDADAAEWITATFGAKALEYLFEPMLEGFYFQPPERMSCALPLVVWSFGSRGRSVMTLSGGIGTLPEALARSVTVHRSTAVKHVEVSEKEVCVETSERSFQFDYVIMATTSTVARALYQPKTDVEEKLLSTGYSSTVTISVPLSGGISEWREVSGLYGVLIPRSERKVVAAVAFESRKCADYVPEGGELLNVMLCGDAGKRLVNASRDRVLEEVCSELKCYVPWIVSSMVDARLYRWEDAEPLSPAGRSRCLHRYRQIWRPDMRIILAGDYMGIPCTEGAAESGQWAATMLANSTERHAI